MVMPDKLKQQEVYVAPPKAVSTARGDAPQSSADEIETPQCRTCSLILRIALSLLVWLLCGAPLAVLNFVVMGVTCLQEEMGFRYRASRGFPKAGAFFLLLLSIAGIGWYFWQMFSGNCQNASWWPLLLPAIALLLAPWFAGCRVRTTLLVLFQISLWVWCSASGGACSIAQSVPHAAVPAIVSGAPGVTAQSGQGGSIPAPAANLPTGGGNAATALIGALNEHIGQAVTGGGSISTPVEAAVSDPAAPGARISVAQALARPELFASCDHSVYLPNVALFDYNKPDLREQIKPSMQQLVTLLQRYPDAKFEITGHADRSGERTGLGVTHNLQLSQGRADAVGDWLAAEMGAPRERFGTQGVGTRIPFTTDATMEPYNRRVEVKIRCRDENKGGQG
jgi:outer membrane protein OmpA-like peptidoglycan-associated protein